MAKKQTDIGKKLDKRAFESLFKSHFPGLCNFAVKYVEDMDEAKDIVHVVFVNLWKRKADLTTDTPLKSYLFTAVHNRCLNYIRDRKKLVHHELPMDQVDLSGHLESRDHMEESETILRINQALESLPQKCREIFIMSRFDEMKYREIAEKKNISIKTVETQVSRALKQLKEHLKDLLSILIWILLN